MPKNISTLISTLLKRTGIDLTDPKYIDLLNIGGQIGDEAYSEVEGAIGRLMTLDEARYHNDLRRHFRQNVLDPIDKELERWFEDKGVGEEEKADILADKNTYTKLRRTLEKTAELEHKRAGAKTAAESKKIADDLAAAEQRMSRLKEDFDLRAAQLEQQADERVTDYAVRTRLAALPYAAESISRDEAVMAFRPLLDHELRARGIKYVFDKNNNDLMLVRADTGEQYTEGRTPIKFSDLVNSIAAAKRVLKINPDADPANPQHITYPTQVPAGRDLPRSNQNALNIIESKLKGN